MDNNNNNNIMVMIIIINLDGYAIRPMSFWWKEVG